jgi:hypothetical protein
MFWQSAMFPSSESSSPRRVLDPEDGNIIHLKNIGNYLSFTMM